MKRGKKYTEAAKLVDRATQYDVAEAISLVKKTAVAKFDETVEAHIRLGVDGRHADQQVRGAVVLPHGTGKTVRVLVFAKGDKVAEAEAAGADFVGGEELNVLVEVSQQNILSKILQVTFCVTRQPISYDFFFCFHNYLLNLCSQ